MKKPFGRLITILFAMLLLFSGCSRMNQKQGSVFMWEVTAKEGSGKLYLLGSIHAGKEGLYPLNETIQKAYESSDVLAVECDVSTLLQRANLQEIMKKMMYQDGTTLKDHLSPELYEKAEAALKKYGMSIDLFAQMKPFAISSMILSSQMNEWGYDSENGIDMYFLNKAHDEDKTIVEIESVEFQYDLLGGFPDEIQAIELESALEGPDASKEFLDQTFELWSKGDVKRMEALMLKEDNSISEEQKEAYEAYEKAMFDDRNTSMTLKAEEYLKEGHATFFVVGSGHMVGKTGIVQQLSDKGYKVTQK